MKTINQKLRAILLLFLLICCSCKLEAQNNRDYYFFGEMYSLELTDKILKSDESVFGKKHEVVNLHEIIERAKQALKFDVPKGYSMEVSQAGATRFTDAEDNEIWLWEIVFSPKYIVKGEGETGPGAGKISVFLTRSRLAIIPKKKR